MTTDANTLYRNRDVTMTRADWFAAVATTPAMTVEGTLSNGTLLATKVRIGPFTSAHSGG